MDDLALLEARLAGAIRRIIHAVDLHSRRLASAHGLTGPQVATLQRLADGGPTPTGDLARDVRVSQPTMSGIVDRLVRNGHVARERNDPDRRRVRVSITESGREALAGQPSLLDESFREHFSALPAWEQLTLLANLERVAAMMDMETEGKERRGRG